MCRIWQFCCNRSKFGGNRTVFDLLSFLAGGLGAARSGIAIGSGGSALSLFGVGETQSASTTYLQRKLKIGYARAASLMDELEMHGVISSQEGSKPRRVLIENDDETARN